MHVRSEDGSCNGGCSRPSVSGVRRDGPREWPRLSDAPKKSPGSVDMLNRSALYTPIDAAANARRRQTFLRLSAEPLRLILVGTGMVSPFAETGSFKIEVESPDGCHQTGLEISWRPYPGSVKRAVGLT